MKKLSLFAVMIIALCSCKKNSYTLQSLPEDLKSSNTFEKYMYYSDKLQIGLIADDYSFSNVNWDYIHANKKNVHNTQDIYALYKKAGMTNAEEYIDNSMRASILYLKLKKEIPTLNSISKDQIRTIANKVYYGDMHTKKPDYVKLMLKRRANRIQHENLLKSHQNKNTI